MVKFKIDKDGTITTDPNDKESNILVKFKFDCVCGFNGTISYNSLKIKELTVTGNVNFNTPDGPLKCPNCEEKIIVPGGTFILDEETGEMVRK